MINYRCFWLFMTYSGGYVCQKTGMIYSYEEICDKCKNCKEKAKK